MSADELPTFGEPPVSEVALAIYLEPTPDITSAHCAAFWSEHLRDQYPNVQTQPASPMTPEDFGDGLPSAQVVFGFGTADVRYWFLDPSLTKLIQLQNDRLVLNWRKLQTLVYPHYDSLKAELDRVLDLWMEFTDPHVPQAVQTEVTYVNQILEGSASFDSIAHLGAVLEPVSLDWPASLGSPELIQFEQRFRLADLDGQPARFYVSVTPGITNSSKRMVTLTLTLRGRPADKDPMAAKRWLDFAHEHVIRSFSAIASPELRTYWKEGQSS